MIFLEHAFVLVCSVYRLWATILLCEICFKFYSQLFGYIVPLWCMESHMSILSLLLPGCMSSVTSFMVCFDSGYGNGYTICYFEW